MENIEIKASCRDLASAEKAAEAAGAGFAGFLRQTDTYFQTAHGRLKLREIAGQRAQLIFYARADSPGPRTSAYQIYPVEDSDALKELLAQALQIHKVVEKERKLYLYDEVRIHFDIVKGIGNFIELEGVRHCGDDYEAVDRKVRYLIDILKIESAHLVPQSYADLV